MAFPHCSRSWEPSRSWESSVSRLPQAPLHSQAHSMLLICQVVGLRTGDAAYFMGMGLRFMHPIDLTLNLSQSLCVLKPRLCLQALPPSDQGPESPENTTHCFPVWGGPVNPRPWRGASISFFLKLSNPLDLNSGSLCILVSFAQDLSYSVSRHGVSSHLNSLFLSIALPY